MELAIITLAPQTAAPIKAVPVWNDPLDFVAAPEHALANQKEVSLADVARHPAVFPGGNTFTRLIVHGLFDAQGLTPNIAMSTNYLETIKMLVSIGLAWSVLPRTLLDDQVRRLPLPGIQLERRLGYILHTERTHSNAAETALSSKPNSRELAWHCWASLRSAQPTESANQDARCLVARSALTSTLSRGERGPAEQAFSSIRRRLG